MILIGMAMARFPRAFARETCEFVRQRCRPTTDQPAASILHADPKCRIPDINPSTSDFGISCPYSKAKMSLNCT